jgi:putative hydrolase of the HAD superfamily
LYRTIGEELSDQQALQVFDLYLEYFEENWRPFDDVIPCLEDLKVNGKRLGIISNGDDEQQIRKLKKVGVIEYFDTIVTSGRAGRSKPDPAIFEYACREADCPPEACVYVGDDLEVDILSCQSCRMRGKWINRNGVSSERHEVVTISRLTELKDIIRR